MWYTSLEIWEIMERIKILRTANVSCECYQHFLISLYNSLAIKHTYEEQITAVPLQHLPWIMHPHTVEHILNLDF
jgi:hypothetical protein